MLSKPLQTERPGSWQTVAKPVAEKIYGELHKEFPPGMIRMIIRALERVLNREEKIRQANEHYTPKV